VVGGVYSHKNATPSQLARSYSFMQRKERERERDREWDPDRDRDEDDSMHEKYFMNPSSMRSVESTPQTRRYTNSSCTKFKAIFLNVMPADAASFVESVARRNE